MFRKMILFFLCLVLAPLTAEDTPVLKRTGKKFSPKIPTLKEVLQHDLGERIINFTEMEKYIRALAASSPRIILEEYGKSYEGRTLYYLIVSSAENISQLEQLRTLNLRLSDARKTTAEEAESIIKGNPVFVNLSSSVHGDELSGTEAVLTLAYCLAAADDKEILNILQNCVVIIDPLQNPDGRERFVHHYYSTAGPEPNEDPFAAEHHEPWPGGRFNHYLFDMNRDWFILTQQETRAKVDAYRRFQPQIFIDIHEMGYNSTYYFLPPAIPYNPHIPSSMHTWWKILGKAIATDFDRYQIDYYTNEYFDAFYPGYGDAWPTLNGALASTFEQASISGIKIRREDGKVLHYRDAVWHQFTSSFATCKMASEHRESKLRDYYHSRSNAIREGKTGPIRHFIISRSKDPLEADRIVANLLRQGIEVQKANTRFRVKVHDYYQDHSYHYEFAAGDYIISLAQPLKHLVLCILSRDVAMSKAFLAEESRRRKNDQPSAIYDITAWSLPLACGIDVYWSGEIIPVTSSPLQVVPKVTPTFTPASYAYLIDYSSNHALQTIIELQKKEVRVSFCRGNFTLAGHPFSRGSFIIKVKENPQNLHDIMTQVARNTGVQIYPSNTGWTEKGPDLGSDNVIFLKRPKLVVLCKEPTSPTSYGAIMHMLERRYRLKYTPLPVSQLSKVNLREYNVLVLPDEGRSYGEYGSFLDKKNIAKLKHWVERGGTLIAVKDAAKFIIDNGKLSNVKRIKKFRKDSTVAKDKKDKDKQREHEEPDKIQGAILRVKLNQQHFLTFGYTRKEIAVLVNSDNVFVGKKHNVANYSPSNLKISGHIWDIAAKRLAKKSYLTQEKMADGHVILFAEDPNFRGYWDGLTRLFMNGILFGPSR